MSMREIIVPKSFDAQHEGEDAARREADGAPPAIEDFFLYALDLKPIGRLHR
jgi:hypothetical protein